MAKYPGLFENPRDGIWLYRKAIPEAVRDVIGKTMWIKSFGTTDRREAESKWSLFDAEFQSMIAQAQGRALIETNKDHRRVIMWDAIAAWLYACAAQNGGRLPLPENVEIPTESRITSHAFTYVRHQFQTWAKVHAPDAVEVLNRGDLTQGGMLFHHGLTASYFVVRALLERTTAAPIRIEPEPPVVPVDAPRLVQIGTTLEQVQRAWSNETDPTPKHEADVTRARLMFEETNPGVSVEQTERGHVAKFRARLGELETSNKTKNRYLAGISALFGHARKKMLLIDANPFENVKFTVKDEEPQRDAFTDANLKVWFAHPTFTKLEVGTHGAAEYWLPLLALYHGARQSEIAQLHRDDVIRDPDSRVWYMSIRGEVGGDSDKRVKNTGSRRIVPLHQAVIDLGFLKFVDRCEGRLFPTLKRGSNGGSFSAVSKFTRDQLDHVGITDPRLTFHSLRHTARTRARSTTGITEEQMDYLVGHVSVTQGRKYGTHELAALKAAIDRLTYPIRVKAWKS
ncbi:MAG: site-specific integrase [Alphaproteobacteria bacterium]|nr:site-specific integrase [Alphaproteobacteria bacterium]MCW5742185.1 site-specific integrase [Alphaproteobacteria bacterium]